MAFKRVANISEDVAKRAVNDVQSYMIHSDCRVRSISRKDPTGSTDEEIWDGIQAIGLLYPYEDEFTPRDYESVAQEVISVGTQIEEKLIKKMNLDSELILPGKVFEI